MVKNLVEQYPKLYLDELRDWIIYLTGEEYSIPTLSRYLWGIGLTVKKVCFYPTCEVSSLFGKCQFESQIIMFSQLHLIAKQRDKLQQAQYRRFISQFYSNQLLFIDESP